MELWEFGKDFCQVFLLKRKQLQVYSRLWDVGVLVTDLEDEADISEVAALFE